MTRLKKLISAALALSLLGGSAAMAQNFGRGGNQPQVNRTAPQDNRDFGRGPGPQNNRGFDGRGPSGNFDRNRGGNFSFGFGVGPGVGSGFGLGYGYGPGYGYAPGFRYDPYRPVWHVGQRFSPYGAQYIVVNDWYRFHLRRPPYGYHWVQVNGDYLLVGITSGLIADLLLGHNYY